MNTGTIAHQIRETRFAHVKLYYGQRITQNSNPVFSSSDYYSEGGEESPEETADFFEGFMANMPAGNYVVKLLKTANNTKSVRERKFRHVPDTEEEGHPGGLNPYFPMLGNPGGIQQHIEDQVNTKLDAFIAKLQAERERERYEEQISGLRQELAASRGWEPKIGYIFKLLAERNGIPAMKMAEVAKHTDLPTRKPEQEEETPPIQGDQVEDFNVRMQKSASEMAGKLGTETPAFMEKLAALDADKLEKLAALPNETIEALTEHL